MKIKNIILLIFFLTLIFRLFFIFKTPHFSDDSAYFNIRQVENIMENKKISLYDNLSYSGRTLIFSPLFHYILSVFVLIFGKITFKLLPVLLISSLVFLVYLISKTITQDKSSIIFASLTASFIPILITTTLNNVSIYSLLLPLIFYMIYCTININEKKYLNRFLLLSVILPLLHPITFLIVISLILYMIITNIEDIKLKRINKEAFFFFIFLTLLIQFIIYKKAFLALGFNIIWQNIPIAILSNYFKQISIPNTILSISLIPLIFGITGIYFGIKQKKEPVLLLSSIILATAILLALKLINFNIGLMFLGLSLAIISSLGFEKFFKYVKITKFSKFEKPINILLLILIILLLVIPSYVKSNNIIKNTITDKEVESLKWLKDNTEQDSIVLSSIQEGHYITQIAKRKNVIDSNFMFIPNINKIYSDINLIFTTESQTKALKELHKYNVRYIYLSKRTKQIYNIKNLKYTNDKECFRQVRKEEPEIYKVRC